MIPQLLIEKTVEVPEGTRRVGIANLSDNMLGVIALIPGHAPQVWHPGMKQWFDFDPTPALRGEKGLILPNLTKQ